MPFPKKSDPTEIPTESNTWNVAPGFSYMKILKLLLECDRYKMIAIYGSYDLDDFIPENEKLSRKIEALNRLKDSLITLIENTSFSIKKKDKDKLKEFRTKLENVNKTIGLVSKEETDSVNKTKTIKIKPIFFNKTLKILLEIKEEILPVLNNANLIFKTSEEISIEDIKNKIIGI